MTDPGTSFSIEVLGFPRESDPEAVAASVAGFFGISIDEGRRLVRKVPVRVKRNAPASVAQQLVRQLRKLGADVLVRNEQTGDERTYRLADEPLSRPSFPMGAPPISEPEPSEPTPAEDTLESEDHNAPVESPPKVHVVVPLTNEDARVFSANSPPVSEPVPVSVPVPLPPRSPSFSQVPEARKSSPSNPGQPSSQPGDTRPRLSSGSFSLRPPATISLPPPSQPVQSVPPPGRTTLDFCASCKSPMEKGEVCTRCGWDSAEKLRRCRQCKKRLALVSNVSKSPVLVAVILAGSIAMAAAAFFVSGALAAGAALAFGIALGFLGDGLTLRYACKTCTVAVYSERLQKEEQARIAAARRRSLAVAAVCGVAAAGLGAVPGGSSKTLSASSYGMAWTIQVPATHGRIGSEVAMVQLPTGTRRLRVQSAERAFFSGQTYHLANLQNTYPAGPAEPDKAALQASIRQLAEVVFNGSLSGGIDPSGDSQQADFSGTFHGKPVFGRVRGTQYEHDMVLVAVTASKVEDLGDPAVEKYLSSLAVERDAK